MPVVNDSKEQIQKCLSCIKKECTNCVDTMTRYSVKKERKKRTGRIDEVEFYRLYNLGYSDIEMAKVLGVSRENVCSYRFNRNLKLNKCGVFESAIN